MSQRRSKKELSIMDNVDSLSDQQLRAALKKYDVTAGPITDSTRNLYKKKLASIIASETPEKPTNEASTVAAAVGAEENDEDDTSDEDFNVREDELEDEDEEDEEFEDDEEEDLMSELQDDANSTYSRINTSELADLTTREPGAAANRISGSILISLVSFFVIIFSLYLLSSSNFKFLEPLKPFKNITKQILTLAALSPIGFIVYKTYRYYRMKRHEEDKRVCKLVSEALELLQSPDNPKGLMPILHIRDTLLSPSERKAKKMTMLWDKAIKFIEDHESRVKVEIVNIDGEDFRAWKWIGSRKL